MICKVIIPARMHSSRLPGKVLLDIQGKPMLQHVYEQACKSSASEVVIATDSEQVYKIASQFGATVCMTDVDHQSGTERIAQAVKLLGYDSDDIIVNIQADEPLMPPTVIDKLAVELEEHKVASMATVCCPVRSIGAIFDPNVVKVVLDKQGFAMYFSRAPIAWEKDAFGHLSTTEQANTLHYRHVGIYAYRVGFLETYAALGPCHLSHAESLEQLKVLWNGGRIWAHISQEFIEQGVDTEKDLQRVRQYFVEEGA